MPQHLSEAHHEVERWDDEGGSLRPTVWAQRAERQAVAEENLRRAVAQHRRRPATPGGHLRVVTEDS